MNNFSDIDAIFMAIAFIVPGYIFSHVKNQFVTGRENQGKEQFVRYLTCSLCNYAIFSWLIYIIVSLPESNIISKSLLWSLILLICPAGLGILAGVASQKGWVYQFLKFMGLRPVHFIPTAWDWKFARLDNAFVLVTLKDDTKYYGWCSTNSFMSSDPFERDIYIEKMYDFRDSGEWTDRGNDSVLICGGNIKTIEFISSEKTMEKKDE